MRNGTLFIGRQATDTVLQRLLSPNQRAGVQPQRNYAPVHRAPIFGDTRRRMFGAGELASYDYGTALQGQPTPEQLARLDARARILAAGGSLMEPRQPLSTYVQPVPIPATVVPAGATVTIPVEPEFSCAVRRNSCPSNRGPIFEIANVEIARTSQFLGSGGVSASAFSEVATQGLDLKGDTVTLGQKIQVTVTNLDVVSRIFRGAALYCEAQR